MERVTFLLFILMQSEKKKKKLISNHIFDNTKTTFSSAVPQTLHKYKPFPTLDY